MKIPSFLKSYICSKPILKMFRILRNYLTNCVILLQAVIKTYALDSLSKSGLWRTFLRSIRSPISPLCKLFFSMKGMFAPSTNIFVLVLLGSCQIIYLHAPCIPWFSSTIMKLWAFSPYLFYSSKQTDLYICVLVKKHSVKHCWNDDVIMWTLTLVSESVLFFYFRDREGGDGLCMWGYKKVG